MFFFLFSCLERLLVIAEPGPYVKVLWYDLSDGMFIFWKWLKDLLRWDPLTLMPRSQASAIIYELEVISRHSLIIRVPDYQLSLYLRSLLSNQLLIRGVPESPKDDSLQGRTQRNLDGYCICSYIELSLWFIFTAHLLPHLLEQRERIARNTKKFIPSLSFFLLGKWGIEVRVMEECRWDYSVPSDFSLLLPVLVREASK